ncbi:MAG: MOSC N-terminal beta barrel domain-containing protein, partial [Bacteroidota bacterium]
MSVHTVSSLQIYPLKSGGPLHCQRAEVQATGLQYDRHWALFDAQNRLLTGRAYPQLLELEPEIQGQYLYVHHRAKARTVQLPLTFSGAKVSDLQFFSRQVAGVRMNTAINDWFSDYLGFPCQLFFMNEQVSRPVLAKHGGQPGDVVSFADQSPLLLLSTASIADLNTRLDQSVHFQNFRPNIVVEGAQAYEEDQWRRIQIGSVEFEVNQRCQRCVFINIDPFTKIKHKEPLKTLATYRTDASGQVIFGVH